VQEDHEEEHIQIPVSVISKPENRSERESVLESRPPSIHQPLHHGIRASPIEISRIESSRELLQTPSLILESALHENEIMPDISWHDILSVEKRRPPVPKEKPRSHVQSFDSKKVNRRVSNFDLSDSDLKKILNEKKKCEDKSPELDVVDDDLFDFYSVQFVSKLSCNLADEILKSICNEFVNSDLISSLIDAELKA